MAKGPDAFTSNMFESDEVKLPPSPPQESKIKTKLTLEEEITKQQIIEELRAEYLQENKPFSESENEALINQRLGFAMAEKKKGIKPEVQSSREIQLDQIDRKRISGGDFAD
jgi:hypothetical protein